MGEAIRRRFLDNVLTDTHRLGLLVQRLIELTRAESTMARNETTTVAQTLSKMVPPLLVELAAGAHLPLAISDEALGTVLANLVDNVHRHAAAKVGIRAGHHGDGAVLEVCDNGIGVMATNRERIFYSAFRSG